MTTKSKSGRKKITGFHATLIFVAFFGVIMAVNFLMASFAISSFGGTVVDNSYVASQNYNIWIQQGREQEEHGWTIGSPVRAGERVELSALNASGQPLANARVTALVDHPVGRSEPFELSFSEIAPGQYRSVENVPAGRWKLKISVSQGDRNYRMLDEVK